MEPAVAPGGRNQRARLRTRRARRVTDGVGNRSLADPSTPRRAFVVLQSRAGHTDVDVRAEAVHLVRRRSVSLIFHLFVTRK